MTLDERFEQMVKKLDEMDKLLDLTGKDKLKIAYLTGIEDSAEAVLRAIDSKLNEQELARSRPTGWAH